MAKSVYGFKDKAAAQRAAEFFGQNEQSEQSQGFYSQSAPSRIRLVEVSDDMDGHGTELDDVQFPTSEVEIIRTTTNPQSLLSETTDGFHSVFAAPLEPTNYPAEAHAVAITDTFNQTFLVTPTPSEVFGKLNEYWNGIDYEHPVEISLDDDFTVQGSSTLMAYPAPTLVDNLMAGDEVSCRFVKSVGKWFFFRPVTGRLLTVSGDPLFYRIGGPARIDFTVFYSEILANELIGECQLMAWPKKQEITGTTFHLPWVKYPTNLITPYEVPDWVGFVDQFNGYGDACYQYKDSNNTYHIVPTDYYGLVFFDETGATSGNSRWWMPELRQINGYGYWRQKYGGGFIYYTAKRNNSNDWKWGWTKGNVLGKWLSQNDTQPFTLEVDLPAGGWFEQAASFASSLGYAAKKPEWTSNSQFGIYTANSINSGPQTTQFGCARWIASDGRTLSGDQIMYFTHTSIGTKQFWIGRYTCQAFNKKFKNIEYLFDSVAREYYYYLGDRTAGIGYYRSSTAPSTSSTVTFEYVSGARPLKGTLRFISSVEGTETWEMTLSTGAKARYTCAESATSMTMGSVTGDYYFSTVSKSGDYWVALGVDSTVGDLVFDGETLDAEAGNDFIFNHEILLTFDQYVQGSEHECVYICNPGVLS